MKISKQKINKIIKESIRSILFESRFESMSAEELLAVDFESLSPEEKNDYEIAFDNASDTLVDDFDDEEDDKGLQTSRRGFLKGMAGAAALGGVGKFALDQIKTKTASMNIFSESPLDLSNEIDMTIYSKGIRELKQRGGPTFFHPKEIVDEIFSGIDQCSTRELIQIAVPIIAKKLSSDLQSKSRGLTDEGKMALAQMYYEYYNSVADYLGIFFSEILFQMLYYHNDNEDAVTFIPLSVAKTYGIESGHRYLMSDDHLEQFDDAEGEHTKLLEGGLLDKQFVRVSDGIYATSSGEARNIILEIFQERVHGQALWKVYRSIKSSDTEYEKEYEKTGRENLRRQYTAIIYKRGEIHDKRNKGELTFDEADRLLNDLSKSEKRISAAINSSATINDTNNEVTDFFGSYMNPYGEGLKDTTGEKIK